MMKTTLLCISAFLVLGTASAHLGIRGEHIAIEFFIAGEYADQAQDTLRELLSKFPEEHGTNLTLKLAEVSPYFELSRNASSTFASTAEEFFNQAKNESTRLLLKLRQVPLTDTISGKIKSQLTDYFSEWENYHVILSGILDETTEFVLDSVEMLQKTLLQFTDAQNDIAERRKAQADEWCRNRCDEWMWESTEEVTKCATGKMRVAYDVYSITKITTYHVMKMLEHRIQKLYNCFLFGNYPIRCRFVRNAEADFERLHTRLDELLMYNEKQKRKIYRKQQRGRYIDCIPEDFPDAQMPESLKSCFYFSRFSLL